MNAPQTPIAEMPTPRRARARWLAVVLAVVAAAFYIAAFFVVAGR